LGDGMSNEDIFDRILSTLKEVNMHLKKDFPIPSADERYLNDITVQLLHYQPDNGIDENLISVYLDLISITLAKNNENKIRLNIRNIEETLEDAQNDLKSHYKHNPYYATS
jgi:hypothetical protein